MLAGLRGGDGVGRVLRVAGADVHRIDVGIAEHVVEVRVDGVDAGVLRIRLGEGLDHVADRDHVYPVGMLQVRGHVCPCDASGAYHADFQWFGHNPRCLRALF